MGKYLDIIRRAEAERGAYDKNDLNDKSPPSSCSEQPKGHLKPNTAACAVCGATDNLWRFDDALVHAECAEFLPKPEFAEPSATYQAASPDCKVTIVQLPKAQRYRKVFGVLQVQPPALVPVERWQQAVEDGKRFLAAWGSQAEALGWTSADLFGLAAIPEKPHPSYSRLSRYDQTGLCWLLDGCPVVALTADTASIRHPTGSITAYRKHHKPALGPLGDSLDDFTS